MQISTKFTIAIHVLTAVRYFSGSCKVTSDFLAGSVGNNPVIIRNIMSQLREAGIIDIKRGPGGISLTRPLTDITFLDVYRAVEKKPDESLFHFHEHPSDKCPVGRNIHESLEGILDDIQQKFEAELQTHTLQEVYDRAVQAINRETV
jgi:DNA-binding IscR family transcriptional regulator